MTKEQVLAAEVERMEILLEISRELKKRVDRLIEINRLIEVSECTSKNELWIKRDELIGRVNELVWKLRRL